VEGNKGRLNPKSEYRNTKQKRKKPPGFGFRYS
jgi:hypothetical protein